MSAQAWAAAEAIGTWVAFVVAGVAVWIAWRTSKREKRELGLSHAAGLGAWWATVYSKSVEGTRDSSQDKCWGIMLFNSTREPFRNLKVTASWYNTSADLEFDVLPPGYFFLNNSKIKEHRLGLPERVRDGWDWEYFSVSPHHKIGELKYEDPTGDTWKRVGQGRLVKVKARQRWPWSARSQPIV